MVVVVDDEDDEKQTIMNKNKFGRQFLLFLDRYRKFLACFKIRFLKIGLIKYIKIKEIHFHN